MSETKEIPVFHPTFDFDTLMREAQKHITELAGDLWSDHNPSDPGITQLEVLAFCIADLSYRTSFDVKDILAGYKGGLSEVHDLPLANIALPNNPVTIKDLRKLLVDMLHPEYLATKDSPNKDDHYPTKLLVRNAFPIIAEENEVPFYAVSRYGRESFLTYDTSFEEIYGGYEVEESEENGPVESDGPQFEPVDASPPRPDSAAMEAYSESPVKRMRKSTALAVGVDQKGTVKEIPKVDIPFTKKRKKDFQFLDRIQLNGLYSLQIEFEEDIHFDPENEPYFYDLNRNYFISEIPIDGVNYEVSVLMPYWDDIRWSLKNVDLDLNSTTLDFVKRLKYDYMIAVDKLNYDDYFYDYYAEVNLSGHTLPLYIKTQFRQGNQVYQGIPDEIVIGGKTYRFIANFLDWNELSNGVNQNYNSQANGNPHQLEPNLSTPDNDLTQWGLGILPIGIEGELHTYDIKSKYAFKKERITTNNDGTINYHYDKDKNINLLTRITFEEGTIIRDDEKQQIEAALLAKYPDLFNQQIALEQYVKAELKNKEAKIYADYLKKINRVFDLLYGSNGIWSYLGKYRNLGEDYAQFSASRVQEVALFGKLIAAPNYNVNELLAEIYFRIDQFLSPLIKFWSLGEMVKKGHQFEELFNGPLLKNGFIEDEDLNNLKRRSVVYTSDLIRIIMDVPGVEAVGDFSISSYIDNRLMGRNVLNCLSLINSSVYKPRFTGEKTRLEVWVNDEKQTLDEERIKFWYGEKKKLAKHQQISAVDNSPLQVPVGQDMEIEKYYSIQHDFPEVYGIGAYGLPNDATEERKARAKQLKAYLLPFEQLLANYLKQVAHLPEIFSFSRAIDKTYHYQPLYDIPDVQPLLEPFRHSGLTWDNFKQDIHNAYMLKVDEGESDATFKSRRNRFLNHLLARFGESFAAYSTQMFNRNQKLLNEINGIGQYRIEQEKTLMRLINDQITFAEDYARVSGERYNAFDMTLLNTDLDTGQWNNFNIGSYKRRLCRLLGIENVENKFIFQTHKNDDGEWIDEEGMHIVEHILLRPRTTQSSLLKLKNEPIPDSEGNFIFEAEKDPYSFRITIVLPRYADRFKEKSFRQFTERLIRMETPAHIRVDFRWLFGECGKNFEKDYSEWKQNVYKLKPWLFRNIETPDQIDHKALTFGSVEPEKGKLTAIAVKKVRKTPLSKADLTKIEYVDDLEYVEKEVSESILVLQNNLVQALQSSCELRLEAFNANDEIFTELHGKITFENKKTDVHHLRVNEVGGTITVYKLSRATNNWESVTAFKPITQNYFDVDDFLNTGNGLTTEYGGRGLYKVVYEMEDRDSATVVIDVTKTIIKPNIFIADMGEEDAGAVMLNFNTETDGVFRSSNQTWARHFLQFQPKSIPASPEFGEPEEYGMAYIASPSKGLAKTVLHLPESIGDFPPMISFMEIYKQYGIGSYHITYVLDGQVTFADIELFLELSITAFDGKTQLLPGENGIIVVPADVRLVNLVLDIPDGGLTVYDLDGNAPMNEPGSFSDPEANPFGGIAYYKKIGNLLIDRDKDPIYKDDNHYRFVYEHSGEQVSAVVFFVAPKIDVKPPSVKLFEKGTLMEEPHVLIADGKERDYQIEFHPKDAEVEAWILDEGQPVIIASLTVPSDYFREIIKADEVYGEHGPGPIFVKVKNDAGEADLQFTVKYDFVELEPTTLVVKNLLSGELVKPMEEVYTLVYDYETPKQLFELKFNNGGGELILFEEDGNEYVIPVDEHTIQFNGTSPLIKGLPTGVYKCIYQPKEGSALEFVLNVVNLNPEFVLKDIFYERPSYYATGVPLDPDAKSYIWRIDEKFVSSAKNPKLNLNFGQENSLTIKLTMHLEDYEANYELMVTRELIKKWRDEG